MGRLIRFCLNKIYTFCNILMGMKVGPGSMIHCRSELRHRQNITLGKKSVLYKKLTIYISKGGSLKVGNNSHIAPHAYCLVEDQNLIIGNDVAIGPYCSFFCLSNTYSDEKPLFRENYIKGDITVGDNVFIGAQSVIMPGTSIGNNVIIAANSVVKGTLDGGQVYAGSPCKPIKKLSGHD